MELPVVEEDLAGVEHLFALSDRRMSIAVMQKHLSLAGAHEVVLLIGDVDAVSVHAMKAILIGKTVQPKNIARIDRFDSARMQVRKELYSLHDPRSGSLYARLRGDPGEMLGGRLSQLWSTLAGRRGQLARISPADARFKHT